MLSSISTSSLVVLKVCRFGSLGHSFLNWLCSTIRSLAFIATLPDKRQEQKFSL